MNRDVPLIPSAEYRDTICRSLQTGLKSGCEKKADGWIFLTIPRGITPPVHMWLSLPQVSPRTAVPPTARHHPRVKARMRSALERYLAFKEKRGGRSAQGYNAVRTGGKGFANAPSRS